MSSTPSEALRVGVIGTGGIAQQHVLGYRAAGAEVVALCDVDAATLARRQQEWGVAAGHTHYDALLADPTIAAVSICTPNSSHHPITLAAAAAGKHVLCEKPVSLDLGQAAEMIAACDAAGVVFQVGHHMRSWVAAVKAKELIDSGALGRVTFARFRQTHDWGGAARVRGVFGTRADSGGGTLLDNGCHLFDLARYLCGDVHDVFARIATLKFAVEVEDTSAVSLGFASGALGQIEAGWTSTGFQEAFWIDGTDGSLECDNRNGANVLLWRRRDAATSGSWSDTDTVRHEWQGASSHTRHVANFIAAIERRRPVVCTGRDGQEAVRLVLASYASVDAGGPVRVADVGATGSHA